MRLEQYGRVCTGCCIYMTVNTRRCACIKRGVAESRCRPPRPVTIIDQGWSVCTIPTDHSRIKTDFKRSWSGCRRGRENRVYGDRRGCVDDWLGEESLLRRIPPCSAKEGEADDQEENEAEGGESTRDVHMAGCTFS